MKFRTLAFYIALLASGAAQADMIDGVKGAILSFDRSMTIGQAFDGWANCASTEWKQGQTNRGQNIVISICHMKDASEFLRQVASSRAVSQNENSEAIHLRGLRKAMVYLQWNINVDETFQLAHTEAQYAWSDGKYIQVPLNPDETITQIYDDVVSFDLSNLEDMEDLETLKVIRTWNAVFYTLYREAVSGQGKLPEGDYSERTLQGVIVGPEEAGDPYALKFSAPVSLPATEACDAEVRDYIFLWANKGELQSYAGKKVSVTGVIDCPRGGQVLRNTKVKIN